MWFVEEDGKLYVRTPRTAGKVRRIRNNPEVGVAPCDWGGGVRGDWVRAEARLVEDEKEAYEINERVRQKYGLLKRVMDLMNLLRGNRGNMVTIELRLRSESEPGQGILH